MGIPPVTRTLRTFSLMAALAVSTIFGSTAARAGDDYRTSRSARPLTIAVIGDLPYGAAQEASVGTLVAAVNGDPKVRLAMHLGDVKSGSTTCSNERFNAVLATFESFNDPLVYTPGDNDWTDCHRVNNGAYNPLERLDAVRATFFAQPGRPLGGGHQRLDYQDEYVENVRWTESRVAFATLHVIGSNNGLNPWTGLGNKAPTAEQAAEVTARTQAVLEWIDETFDEAVDEQLRGVVLAMQADTFDPAPTSAQAAIVDRIAARTAAFDGEVLLLQGDSHEYTVDNPLMLPNFTRIVVHGETLPFEYLRLTIDAKRGPVFSWERVPVAY